LGNDDNSCDFNVFSARQKRWSIIISWCIVCTTFWRRIASNVRRVNVFPQIWTHILILYRIVAIYLIEFLAFRSTLHRPISEYCLWYYINVFQIIYIFTLRSGFMRNITNRNGSILVFGPFLFNEFWNYWSLDEYHA